MRHPWGPALILTGLLVGLAIGATDKDILESNRRLLGQWRNDPDHYQRLLRDLRAFYALPRPRQQQVREFDRELHNLPAATQTRLWSVLERYNTWLEKLPEEQRQQIIHAPDTATRLAIIRNLRLREWLPLLPVPLQQEVGKLPEAEQSNRIETIRFQQRMQRERWARDRLAADARIPRPKRLSEMPLAARTHVEKHLLPRLTVKERAFLDTLEGKYPNWLRKVMELAELHPVLPPGPIGEITHLKQLPADVKVSITNLPKSKKGKGLFRNGGKWPEFALRLQRIAHDEKIKCPPLGASKPSEFSTEIRAFLAKELMPKLTFVQRAELNKLQGRWPEYPKQLLKLAREKHLIIPGMSLPGPLEMWDNAHVRGLVPIIAERLVQEGDSGGSSAGSGVAPAGGLPPPERIYSARRRAYSSGES